MTQQLELSEENTSDNGDLRARKAALFILTDVLERKQTLDQSLESQQAFLSLSARDKAFCRMMVTTAIRRLGQVDDLIARAESKPGSTSGMVMGILRLGITQIMFMEVPDHAAVDTAVRLTEHMGMERQKGFVNGVLRTITREGREWITKQDEVRLNTPEWLLKIWINDYDLRTAAEIARANLAEAPLDITIRDEKDRVYWNSAFSATEIGAGTLRKIAGGSITELEGFHSGKWWVQDASAALPASLFGDIQGKTVVDLCAAPGGKTMQLAARGAHVIAIDRSATRLNKLKENLSRMELSAQVEVVVSDAAAWKPKTAPQYILLDAPCSATGTIRRHPDVPYLKNSQDIDRLADTQARLLRHAFDILAPAGVLIYCVCSIQKTEGEEQINRFLSETPTAVRMPITAAEIGDINEAITIQGDVRLLPFHMAAMGGMDGFYIARVTKLNG